MKTSHAFTLAAISLSLTLCACDKGDQNSGPIPTVPSTPPTTAGGEAKPNPAPPETTDTAKPMNPVAGAPGAEAEAPVEVPVEQTLSMLNGMIKNYAAKQGSGGQQQMRMMSSKDPKAAKKQYEDMQKKAASSGKVTSLDQLVSGNMIKSIPAAPAGKKFVLDVATQTVKLENK